MKLPRKTREGETTWGTPKVGASEDSTTRGEAEKPKAEEAKTTACSRDVEKTCSRDAVSGAKTCSRDALSGRY